MADALSHTLSARLRLERNGTDVAYREYVETDEEHTQHSYQRISLANSMTSPQVVDLQGITTADSLFLYTTRGILVGVNTNTMLLPVSSGGALMVTGSITSVYLQNLSSTYTASVELALTD